MKKYYTLLTLFLTTFICFSQGYTFGVVQVTDYNFKVVAIPDFISSGNTDISDVGFTLMLPAGNADVVNTVGLLGGRPWTVNSNANATILLDYGGDGTKDAFLITLDPGQTLVTHAIGDQIDLISFDVSNMPTSGVIEFLLNTDPITINLGNALDSFYNSNIDNTTTQDYFSGLAVGMENFNFSNLSTDEFSSLENEISIYPNPSSDIININTSVITVEKLILFDYTGKVISSSKYKEQIKVGHLQNGLYFLKIQTQKGEITKKIIVN